MSSSVMARRVLLLGVALALGACATTAPPAPEPVPEAEPPPAPAPPPPPIVEPPPPEPPPPPPEAPKGSIESRSLHPHVDLVDWTLANGLRVVFKRLESDGFAVRSVVPEREGADVVAEDGVPDLEAAVARSLEAARLGASLIVVVGPADSEAAEGTVGTRLGGQLVRRPGAVAGPRAVGALAWEDLPSAFVLRSVLDRRDPRAASVTLHPSTGEARLFLAASSVENVAASLRSATDAEVREARLAVEADAALWAETLAFLYTEPGAFSPARRPEAAADLLARLGAVPPSAVNALLDRLRAGDSTR